MLATVKFKNILKPIILLLLMIFIFSCRIEHELNEEDKIFHAGPNMSGFGGTYFGLYKNNIYEFCDGNFMFPGCYTGKYTLKENVLTLKDLKLNDHVKYNRFKIYRYTEQDSTYWMKKHPNSQTEWRKLKQGDIDIGSDGDVFELDDSDNPIMNVTYYYIIRLDKL